MVKVNVLKIEKRNSLIAFEDVQKILYKKLNVKIKRTHFGINTTAFYFEEPILFSTIEELLFEKIGVKEFSWKFEKAINGGTSYLYLVIP